MNLHYIGFNKEHSNNNINDTIQFAISSYLKNCHLWNIKGTFDITGYKDNSEIANKDLHIFISKEFGYLFILDYYKKRFCFVEIINEKVSIDFKYIYFNDTEMLYISKLLDEYNINNQNESIKNLLEIALVTKYLTNDMITENNLKLNKNKWKIIKADNDDIDAIIKSTETKKVIEYEYSLLLDKGYNEKSFIFFSKGLENIYLVSLIHKKIKYINLKDDTLTIKKDYINLTDSDVEFIDYLLLDFLRKGFFYLEVALTTKVFDGEMLVLRSDRDINKIPKESSYHKIEPFYWYYLFIGME